jgi:hypothetical protein
MAWWRDVEQALSTRPQLERQASEIAAPFFHSNVARFMSKTIAPALTTLALEAMRSEAETCAPVIEGPRSMLRDVVVYMDRRGRWLEEMSALLGLPPLDTDIARLRRMAMEDIQRQVDAAR